MRIVSLCPSTTETLIALGLADALVGVTRFCIHPRDEVRALRKVGGTKTPELEAIAALAPDLVLMNAEENRREDHAALVERGLKVDVTHPRTVAEVPALLRHFGQLTGRPSRAEAFALELEAALAALPRGPRFSFGYLIWRRPFMAAGAGTYIDDLFARAGGENLVRGALYPELELSALRGADVVLLPDEPYPFGAEHVAEVAAGTGARVELISGDDACWHGVRSVRGVALAAKIAASVKGS